MNKNTCLSIVLLSLVSCSIQADYRMIVGLEDASGGNLPDNSIIFKNGDSGSGNGDGGSGNIPDDGNDYSVFGPYAAVAKAIVTNPNADLAVPFGQLLEVYQGGFNLNEYKTLQDYGYRFGLIADFVMDTDYSSLNALIGLHNQGYNLDILGNSAWYMEELYGVPLRQTINKLISTYKVSCQEELYYAFTQIDMSQWDAYAAEHNCLK